MTNKQVGHQPSHIDRETWRQILKAAEELFLAKGYKGVSMKEVADVVQVTPAALYYHFPQGKEDLFMSVIQAMFEEWSAGISRAIAPAHSIRERLNLLTSYLLTLPVDHFPVLIQDAKEQIKDREKQRAIFRQLRGTFQQHIADAFQQAIDAGEVTADIPANLLASMYLGLIIALLQDMHFSAKDSERIEVPRLASILVSVLLDGIACPVQQNNT
ncbi:MAG: TetR/AcrR family transcriptional regulator [Chloroflexi bacterium]|nr:MAG: TetR/AcrR family transcriptional regulator [Chloroflexota bacterium]